MDSQKQFSGPEIQFLLSCSEADENEMINCEEFANRFQEPARDIGFNVAVLLTNLSEHVPHDPRLRTFLELAESILEYFRPYLGRIEIMGASRRIERIYFEISETNRAQWEMPQVGTCLCMLGRRCPASCAGPDPSKLPILFAFYATARTRFSLLTTCVHVPCPCNVSYILGCLPTTGTHQVPDAKSLTCCLPVARICPLSPGYPCPFANSLWRAVQGVGPTPQPPKCAPIGAHLCPPPGPGTE